MEKNTKVLLSVLLVFAVLFTGAACGKRAVPAREYGSTVPATDGLTKKEVADAILRAGAATRWRIKPVADGVMDARLDYKGHVVPATITYDNRGYAIRYAGVAGESVPAQYNKWMNNLDARIRQELLRYVRSR